MDYIVQSNGHEILVTVSDNESSIEKNKLIDNYSSLLKESGKEMTSNSERVLKEIAYSLSESEAQERNTLIQTEVERLKRLSSYAKLFLESDRIKAIIDPVSELLDAYEDYDFDKNRNVNINGNLFSYDPDVIKLEDIADTLFRIGEIKKGNSWTVSISEEGGIELIR